MCRVCGKERCIGKYLLHPKELCMINRLKEEEHKVNENRTFELVESPGNLYVKFMELHVIAGPEEDLSKPLPEVNVYVGDIIEQIKCRDQELDKIKDTLKDILLKNRG